MSLLAELTDPSPDARTARHARTLFDVLAGEDRDLRPALLEWIKQESGLDLGVNEMDTVERLQPAEREGFFEGRKVTWSDRIRAEGVTAGLAAARAEEREHLVGLAARKFGQAPAQRLAKLLSDVNDASRLGEVGGWIIDCETSDELLARVAEE